MADSLPIDRSLLADELVTHWGFSSYQLWNLNTSTLRAMVRDLRDSDDGS